jgi:hypothetical protein
MDTKKTFFEKEAFLMTILIFIPVYSFMYFLDSFIFPKGTHLSDYTISHYPNLLYLQQSIQSGHGVPYWNSQILSGYPTIANPLSGIWYPGNWLSICFPLPFGTHLVTILHLIFGGIGMYLLLRKMELSNFASFFGAMAFQMMPKLFAHYAAGHVSIVQAITYTPWVLYFQQLRSAENKGIWHTLNTAIFYGLVILCDIRWVAYLFIFDLVYFIYEYQKAGNYSIKKFVIELGRRITPVGLSLLFTSFFLLPFLQYVGLSDRSLMDASNVLSYSLPLGKLIGFIIPDMGSYAEYVVYPGLVIWITFLGLLTIKPLRKKQWVLFVFAGLFVIYSFGSSLPFLKWIAYIPGMNLLRVPSRMFFLISILIIIFSAQYLSAIQFSDEPRKTINLLPQFFTLLFAVGIMGIIIYSGDVLISDFYWPVGMGFLLFLLFIFRKLTSRFRGLFQFLLIFLCVIDLTVINTSQYDFYSKETISSQDQEIVEVIKPKESDLYRIYSPSYSVEQHLAAENGISLVDGVDPLHLITYAEFMAKAAGVNKEGYQVTIPTYATGSRYTDNQNAIPNTELLGLLNVKYVVSAFPIEVDGLEHVDATKNAYIYNNLDYLPRAWVEVDQKKVTENITSIQVKANEIEIDAKGPGTLVLSEVDYPGWKVTNNGQKMVIKTAYGILRSVDLSEGTNHIVMKFKPTRLYIGFVISGLTLIVMILVAIFYQGRSINNE